MIQLKLWVRISIGGAPKNQGNFAGGKFKSLLVGLNIILQWFLMSKFLNT
ncbi:MAG: hypothetical protein IPL53_07745 [Ignavibacteria bacterium]|nr:hypothetical protein [Ignavibacteria bacterium]